MSVQPKPVQGLRVPLFDRLVDNAPEVQKEVAPVRLYGRDEVFASIARDLQRLLNARRAESTPLRPGRATVLDYGIPSFTHLSSTNENDIRALGDSIRQAIQAFEPRVQDVTVTFSRAPGNQRAMLGSISCKAQLGHHVEPVTFPIILHSREGEVQVLAADADTQELPLG